MAKNGGKKGAPAQPEKKEPNKPAHEIRMSRMKATAWRNVTTEGQVWFSITLQRTYKDAESYARVNGQPAVALEVSKRAGENIIDTIAKVREVVERERQNWPSEIQVNYSQDRSSDIREMLK